LARPCAITVEPPLVSRDLKMLLACTQVFWADFLFCAGGLAPAIHLYTLFVNFIGYCFGVGHQNVMIPQYLVVLLEAGGNVGYCHFQFAAQQFSNKGLLAF